MRLLVVSRSPPDGLLFLPVATMAEDKGPTAGAGVAAARAVGKKLNFRGLWRAGWGHTGFSGSKGGRRLTVTAYPITLAEGKSCPNKN